MPREINGFGNNRVKMAKDAFAVAFSVAKGHQMTFKSIIGQFSARILW